MGKNAEKFIYWAPRILSIGFILFLAMFSLDVFSPELSWGQIIVGLLIHNVPVFILTTVLIISWKREIVGAITFFSAGILYIAMMISSGLKGQFEWYMLSYSLIIAGPAFLIGALFLINWLNKKKTKDLSKQ